MASNVFGGSADMTEERSLAGQIVLVLEALDGRLLTAAVLDINLGAGPSFDVATPR